MDTLGLGSGKRPGVGQAAMVGELLAHAWLQEGMLEGAEWPRHIKGSTRKVAYASRPLTPRRSVGQALRRYLSQVVSVQARAWPSKAGLGPGWGLPKPRG